MNDNLVKLIKRTREAVDRGDMFVGHESEFCGDLSIMRSFVEIPIGVFDGRVLLKLRVPREGRTRAGELVRIVSYYDGVYYTAGGMKYREKDICWVKQKELPQ